MQSEATWRLQLDDLDEEQARRKLVILRALLERLTGQLETLHEEAIDVAGTDVDERDARILVAHETLVTLRAELEPLLA